eukprot:TRINITY_DN5778_c0_g1_i1.p1 TRINITY_DN5778_c0_g1~~TRINITY_DN5778_c0_g1_i1.p1  ORF type:complete len:556 (+),score=100.33 TRINITY_DN5778_c0_g1_i1:168-1835(+)
MFMTGDVQSSATALVVFAGIDAAAIHVRAAALATARHCRHVTPTSTRRGKAMVFGAAFVFVLGLLFLMCGGLEGEHESLPLERLSTKFGSDVTRRLDVGSLGKLRSHVRGSATGADENLPSSSLVSWSKGVLASAEATSARCDHIASTLNSLRQGSTEDSDGIDGSTVRAPERARILREVLIDLVPLETPATEVLEALRWGVGALRHRGSESLGWEEEELLAEMPDARSRLLTCLLGAAGEMRAVLTPVLATKFLPPSPVQVLLSTSENEECPEKGGPFAGFASVESVAFAEAIGMETDDADMHFSVGAYLSDVGLATLGRAAEPRSTQRLGGGIWENIFGGNLRVLTRLFKSAAVVGPKGHMLLAEAEARLLQGEGATISAQERAERTSVRALRLYKHAKALSVDGRHDAAAEARFRAAAALSASTLPHLAAQSLGRLALLLRLRGRSSDALSAASDALQHDGDPLAAYLQVSLRKELGEFRSEQELLSAEALLRSVAGSLPSRAIEADSQNVLADLSAWRSVADGTRGDWRRCLGLGDVARVLVCATSSLAFA